MLHCLALALLGAPAASHAYSACVGTSQELDDALAQATASTDTTLTIKVREGTYVAGGSIAFYLTLGHSGQTANISGGWSGVGCATHRSGAQSGTVLTGSTQQTALLLHTGFGTNGNTVNVTDLTLRNDAGILNDAVGACLDITLGNSSSVLAYRMLLDGCVGSSTANLKNFSGDLTFANSVVQGGFNAGAPVYLQTNNGVNRLAHLTITGNTATSTSQEASGLRVFAAPSPASQVTLDNSVVWGGIAPAGIPDIATDGPGIVFTRAHYETRSNLNGTVTDNVPSHGNPGFVTPTNPRLRDDSPLVDSGVVLSVGGGLDADGHVRTQGGVVDVGAYEADPDRIHADGFDR